MGPGNKCRDDSLFVARASPPCARGVNAAGTTPEATAVCIQVVTAAVAGDSDIHSAVHEAPLRMPAPIDFYFDFSSPYGYLAAEQVDALAARHGRGVAWRPILLGVVFQQTGGQPLLNIPLKGGYARHALARSARLLGLPFRLPAGFPFLSCSEARRAGRECVSQCRYRLVADLYKKKTITSI